LHQLEVIEVIKKADSGITEPYLCRLSDDQEYYVKGRSATNRGLVAELVCATLGRAFGLPIPDHKLARADPALLDDGSRSSLGTGILFASRKRDGAVPISASTVAKIASEEQQKLFVFDAWIQNEDRTLTAHGGNPNYFLSTRDGTSFVIDHNLAFDPNFELSRNAEMHVCRGAWLAAKENLIVHQSIRADVERLLLMLDDLRYAVPESWLEHRPSLLGGFIEILSRAGSEPFWSALNG
jgi:hypothetical protein